MVARKALGLPLLTWTVRNPDQRRTAERYADQMIFEGFRP
jgi:glycerophosphoryl diester phosphodiesterase